MKQLPLEKIKILDLSSMYPGPLLTMTLADFGADVIRIEPVKGGDLWRHSVPQIVDCGANYFQVNRNKRSMTLNLKSEEAKQIFYKMVRDADVVIEQYRPGVADRLGVGYETLKAINPKLVYCSLSGYGQDGPYRLKAGHDLNYLSYSGILSMTARKGEPPTIPGVQISDVGGGALYGTIAVLIALMGVKNGGPGQYIDAAMLDGTIGWLHFLAAGYLTTGVEPGPNSNILIGQLACYNVYETKDQRYVSIGGVEAHLWANFCEKVGKPEFVEWQRDTSKQPEMFAFMDEFFRARTLTEILEFFDGVDCCLTPVKTLAEAFADPQIQARNMVVEMEDPKGKYGKVKMIGSPIKLSETPARLDKFPPRKGEHTLECLKELGYTDEEVQAFIDNEIV